MTPGPGRSGNQFRLGITFRPPASRSAPRLLPPPAPPLGCGPVPAYNLTVRHGPKVEHERFESLPAALERLQAAVDELSGSGPREAIDLRYRRIEPVRQVAARAEVAGPRGLRGGVDLRGDGSLEAFTGRLRRRPVQPAGGESAYEALRRRLEGRAGDRRRS